MLTLKVVVPQNAGFSQGTMGFLSSAIAEGRVTLESFLRFVQGGKDKNPPSATIVEDAYKILGENNVLAQYQAAEAWRIPMGEKVPVRYSRSTLERCAKENAGKQACWWLVFIQALSLLRQCGVLSSRREGALFSPRRGWLEQAEGNIGLNATDVFSPGYYLLDLAGRFGRVPWSDQEEEIKRLGHSFARANEAVVSEAALSIRMVFGRSPLGSFRHWGVTTNERGERIAVGQTEPSGMEVQFYNPTTKMYQFLRCVLVILPES